MYMTTTGYLIRNGSLILTGPPPLSITSTTVLFLYVILTNDLQENALQANTFDCVIGEIAMRSQQLKQLHQAVVPVAGHGHLKSCRHIIGHS